MERGRGGGKEMESRKGGGKEREGGMEGSRNMKMRAFKIIVIILVFTVLPQLPFIFLIPLYHILPAHDFHLANMIVFVFVFITGFVQPLLYLHRAGKLPCSKNLL